MTVFGKAIYNIEDFILLSEAEVLSKFESKDMEIIVKNYFVIVYRFCLNGYKGSIDTDWYLDPQNAKNEAIRLEKHCGRRISYHHSNLEEQKVLHVGRDYYLLDEDDLSIVDTIWVGE